MYLPFCRTFVSIKEEVEVFRQQITPVLSFTHLPLAMEYFRLVSLHIYTSLIDWGCRIILVMSLSFYYDTFMPV